LIEGIDQVPEPFLDEVLGFVHYLKTKIIKEKSDTAIASESSLKKDWLRPGEDEAWQNLQFELRQMKSNVQQRRRVL